MVNKETLQEDHHKILLNKFFNFKIHNLKRTKNVKD